ncbi:MAG TPA: pectate lyase, partial [Devosia sp.]|nr:pectate lyase [Devosia sp.]
VSVERDVIYDPGHEGTEIFVDCDKGGAPMRFVDNVLRPGPSTWHKLVQYDFREAGDEKVKLAYGDPDCAAGWQGVTLTQADPARQQQVFDAVLAHAGSRPADRDATDRRLVAEAKAGTGSLKDHGEDVVAGPTGPAVFTMPAEPFAKGPDGQLAIAGALCRAHLALGGLHYAGCA